MLPEESPVHLVNQLLEEAQTQGASDIHIEPFHTFCRIRYRQNGVLRVVREISPLIATRMIARLKVMSHLDVAERRLPQDGRLHLDKTDIRISTCPVLHGEKCVLRLLPAGHSLPQLSQTGMLHEQLNCLTAALSRTDGMILVTGPTGSGKTLTLYAALNWLNAPEKNIATAEDPVEIAFPTINQVNINPRAGLNFPGVLRAILRQDPDILMIGEIRDRETAVIAVQAAQTGHLVLSTLHAGSTVEALLRLHAMQVPLHYITGSIRLVIAQRLLRVICPQCRQAGCEHCQGGYRGQTAIFEFLSMSPAIATALHTTPSLFRLEQIARRENPVSLRMAARKKIAAGITTETELLRVLGHEAVT